jgi:hypothetical protein
VELIGAGTLAGVAAAVTYVCLVLVLDRADLRPVVRRLVARRWVARR